MPRTFFVGGNWKLNGSTKSVGDIVAFLNGHTYDGSVEVVVTPSAIHAHQVVSSVDKNVAVALQNCYEKASGAWTGENSAAMAEDIGCRWMVLGHSERRNRFGETDEQVARKVEHVLTTTKLSVILCIGELLEERESGKTMEVVARQMKAVQSSISAWSRVVVAYEPVWAIGTGKVASPEQAQEVHANLRKWLLENVNEDVAAATRIIYGGSVSGSNCKELSKKEDIDGFLVGGASLKPDFLNIIDSCK